MDIFFYNVTLNRNCKSANVNCNALFIAHFIVIRLSLILSRLKASIQFIQNIFTSYIKSDILIEGAGLNDSDRFTHVPGNTFSY